MSNVPADASCTLTPAGTVTDVAVSRKCSVTYTFNTSATQAALALPYAVSLNGTVLPEHEDKPLTLGGERKIKLKVAPGTKVALYLNSDARQGFRSQPVYGVVVGIRDVEINITERLGRGNTETAILGGPICTLAADGKRSDRYDATLTGDIWMKISHRYTCDEASKIIPADTDPLIRAAVLSIYSPLTSRTLTISFPETEEKPAQIIRLTFDEQQSVNANTSYCPLLSHVLPRTHPYCFLALITEARAAGISKLCVNSAWRPSFGSIAHRAGLGLNVYYIESSAVQLNIERKSLKSVNSQGGTNVTKEEKELFNELSKKKEEEKQRTDDANRLSRASKKTPGNPTQAEVDTALRAAESASITTTKARDEWERQLRATEPALIKSFRSRLSARQDINQILDPWYMDFNTRDKIPGSPNMQRSGVEEGHNNHIHITIKEPKIL